MQGPTRPDRVTLAAFAALVVLGGLNFVAVRTSNMELPPFAGAAARMAASALILLALMPLLRVPLPRGSALAGVAVYGLLGFGLSYALLYWALVGIPAGVGSLVMAMVPLLTVLLAALHGVERLRAQAVAGGLLAAGGVGLVFLEGMRGAIAPLGLLAMLGGAVSASESGIVAKRFDRPHPVAMNGLGLAVGAILLAGASLVAREPLALPSRPATWVALTYLVLAGTVGLFSLYLFTLRRWTASATAYLFVLMPLVVVPVAATLAGESVGATFLGGGVLVLAGVLVGGFGVAGRLAALRAPTIEVPGIGRMRRVEPPSVALCAEDGPFPKCA